MPLHILNFDRPFTSAQLAQIRALTGDGEITIHDIPLQIDGTRSLVDVAREACDRIDIEIIEPSRRDGLRVIINPPPLAALAVILDTELSSRAHCRAFDLLCFLDPSDLPCDIVNLHRLFVERWEREAEAWDRAHTTTKE